MIFESKLITNIYKSKQAITADYEHTGYDRGHLNPNSLQCRDGREATFTLTNAAPMDACFNRVHWKNWEGYLKMFLKQVETNVKVYIVTGTVPGNYKIPESGKSKLNRVTVPSHIWTAVCFKHHNENKKIFSFGYLGENKQNFNIKLMSVSDMTEQLIKLFKGPVKIFTPDCIVDEEISKRAQMSFLKTIKLPEYLKLQTTGNYDDNNNDDSDNDDHDDDINEDDCDDDIYDGDGDDESETESHISSAKKRLKVAEMER